jgi:hypothetical protein
VGEGNRVRGLYKLKKQREKFKIAIKKSIIAKIVDSLL